MNLDRNVKLTDRFLRTAGGVAAGFVCGRCATPPITAFDPILRGKVCDLFITLKCPGRFMPTVNFRPDALKVNKFI